MKNAITDNECDTACRGRKGGSRCGAHYFDVSLTKKLIQLNQSSIPINSDISKIIFQILERLKMLNMYHMLNT